MIRPLESASYIEAEITQGPPTFVAHVQPSGEICASRFQRQEDESVVIASDDTNLDGSRLPTEVAVSEIVDRAVSAELTVIAVADMPLGSVKNASAASELLSRGGVALHSEDGGSCFTIRNGTDSAIDEAPRELCEFMVGVALTEIAYPSAMPSEMYELRQEAAKGQFAIPPVPTYFDRFQLALLSASVLGGQADDSVRAVFTPHSCRRLEWSENGSNESLGRNEFGETTISYRNYEQGSVLVLGAEDIDARLSWFSNEIDSASSFRPSEQSPDLEGCLVFEYSALSIAKDGKVRGEQHEGMFGPESGIWIGDRGAGGPSKLVPASFEVLASVSKW